MNFARPVESLGFFAYAIRRAVHGPPGLAVFNSQPEPPPKKLVG